jgi:hypothetical protein
MYNVKSPVVIILFNRPELTKILVDRISKVNISNLLIVIDGPRHQADRVAIEKILEIIDAFKIQNPNCNIAINKSNTNLGCKKRIISGLGWVFNNVDYAIILEDDCLPDLSFFEYCDLMLDKYANDARIGIISGTNLSSDKSTSSSYYFSKYSNIWGWATWARVWENYDEEMNNWSLEEFKRDISYRFFSRGEGRYWRAIFSQTMNGEINTWDYQLWFSLWSQGQLSIIPGVNLVDNLGFEHALATHTSGKHPAPEIRAGRLTFPINGPSYFLPNLEADKKIQRLLYRFEPIYKRAYNKFIRIIKN